MLVGGLKRPSPGLGCSALCEEVRVVIPESELMFTMHCHNAQHTGCPKQCMRFLVVFIAVTLLRQTDTTQLTFAFRNFANAPKNEQRL